eukprot:4084115-Pyramimonas_sp.AAC.1
MSIPHEVQTTSSTRKPNRHAMEDPGVLHAYVDTFMGSVTSYMDPPVDLQDMWGRGETAMQRSTGKK